MDKTIFKNVKSVKDAHYKRSRNHTLTRQMLRHMTDRMLVISSRGYERKEYVTSRQTYPSMRKRRYSIDVTTVEGWGREPTTKSLNTDDNEESKVSGNYDELEPVALQSENMPLPNPLRYAPLTRLRVLNPPHNDGTYLSLEESSLKNTYFNYILDYAGSEAWMDDSILNMALECLRRRHKCSENGIDIINTNLVQSIRMFHLTNDTQGPSSDFIRARLRDKRWIFIPVNDGMGNESYTENRSGSHWYLIIVDRVHKHIFYYDSMGVDEYRGCLASEISRGLLEILGEDITLWTWLEQWHSPCQWEHNQSTGDIGACGPFVFKMCDYMIGETTKFYRGGQEERWFPNLTAEFAPWFKSVFHSLDVRRNMQWLIAHYRCLADSARVMEEHDRLHGGTS